MASFIATIQFTERGIQGIRESCDRAAAFESSAAKLGVKVLGLYWTPGPFDGFIIFEAPDGESASAAMLSLAGRGNVRTQLTRAFTAAEMKNILGKVPK